MPNADFPDTHPIVVLGMIRSGTSSVCAALTKLGVNFGEESAFFPPDENNKTGYFEDAEMVHYNRRILTAYRMAFNSVRPFPEHWLELPQSEIVISELSELIKRKYGGKMRWGFKQPFASPLMPIYKEVFHRLGLGPQYVLCVRNPVEV